MRSQLGQDAFRNCVKIEAIPATLFPNVSGIGAYAFVGTAIKDARFPNKNGTGNNLRVNQGAFSNCQALTNIELSNVYEIGASAFQYCSNLRTLDIRGSMSYVSTNAFYNCVSLTSVSLNVWRIYANAFSGCTSLTNVTLTAIDMIYAGVFAFCNNLKTVTAPTLRSAYSSAFAYCGFTNITFPGLAARGDQSLFEYCSNLVSISLPVYQTVGRHTFRGCSNLLAVNIPEAVSIADEGLSELPITNISAPKATLNGTYAFRNSSNLHAVSFLTMNTTKTSVFENCVSLQHVAVHTTNAFVPHTSAFSNTPATKILYIDSSLVADAKNNVSNAPFANWMTLYGFADIKRLEDYPY